jgi:hypothetical protein
MTKSRFFVAIVCAALLAELHAAPAQAINGGTSQAIDFPAIATKTTAAAPFAPPATASSGLPVTFTTRTETVCEVDEGMVVVINIGTCTIRASQDGDDTFAAATPVDRSFTVSRVLLRNVTMTFVTDDGEVLDGIGITWRTPDLIYRSAKSVNTNAAGKLVIGSIPAGLVRFSIGGLTIGEWTRDTEFDVELSVAPTRTIVVVQWNPPGVIDRTFHIQMPDGSPVLEAKVTMNNMLLQCGTGTYTLGNDDCFPGDRGWTQDSTYSPDEDGDVSIRMVDPATIGCVSFSCDKRIKLSISLADGDLIQSQSVTFDAEDSEEFMITLDQLPVVDLEASDANTAYGLRQTITAVALDSLGDPITGQRLTLIPSSSKAIGTKCRATLSAITNADGRATFYFCPVKTADYRVDGLSIVGSTTVTISVRTAPSAPRTPAATRKTKSVALAWKAPVEINAGRVLDYVIQYRRVGASAWTTFRDGTSSSLKTTVTRLTTGQAYEFRIAAKNSAGTGIWSSVVIATPR